MVAGHPQQVVIALPIVAVWTLTRAIDRGALPRLLAVAAAGGLGAGLAAVQLVLAQGEPVSFIPYSELLS